MWRVESLSWSGTGEKIIESLFWEYTFKMGIEEWAAFGLAEMGEGGIWERGNEVGKSEYGGKNSKFYF